MPSFSMKDLADSIVGRASDARQKVENHLMGEQGVVGQVRRDRKRSREESLKLIREFMLAQTEDVVFLDICDHLKRRPNQMLRQMVNDMVESGELVKTEDYGAGPLIARHLYRVAR